MKILIPRRENIVKTGEEDPVLFCYYPLTRSLFLKRLKMALSLIGREKRESVLEIGYGSGILLPELNRRFNRVHALDIHYNAVSVKEMLKKEGWNSTFTIASVLQLPYKRELFDCVVCLSTLEHIDDLKGGIKEIADVTKKGGRIIFGIPVDNLFMTFFFGVLGYKIHNIHKWSHRQIIEAVKKEFSVDKMSKFPVFLNLDLTMYAVLSCRKL